MNLLYSLSILFSLALLCASASPVHAVSDATTRYVSATGDCGGMTPCHATLQAAIDAASSGDTLKVAEGIYTSSTVQVARITKPLTVQGGYTISNWSTPDPVAHPSVIDAKNLVGRRGILIEGASGFGFNIVLDGLAVRNANNAPPQACAGICAVFADVTIRNSHVYSNAGAGIQLALGSHLVENNVIEDIRIGVLDTGGNGGIVIEGGSATVQGNISRRNGYGVSLILGASATIQNNTLSNNGIGILTSHATSVQIEGNTLSGNENTGIKMQDSGAGLSQSENQSIEPLPLTSASLEGVSATYSPEEPSALITMSLSLSNNRVISSNYGIAVVLARVSGSVVSNTVSGSKYNGLWFVPAEGTALSVLSNTLSGNAGNGINASLGTPSVITLTRNTVSNNNRSGIALDLSKGAVATITNNHIANNRPAVRLPSTDNGGGIAVYGNGIARLTANTLIGNVVLGYGGGIYISSTVRSSVVPAGQTELSRNIVVSNTAVGTGSGIAIGGGIVTGTNDIIAHNDAELQAVYVYGGRLSAQHWTIADNGSYGMRVLYGGFASLVNSIVSGHSVAALEQSAGGLLIANHLLVFNTPATCANNAICSDVLTGNPMFVSPTSLDYHIAPGSAAIDQASGSAVSDDVDGESRPRGAGPDLGADELGDVVVTPHKHFVYLPAVMR